MSRKYNNPSDIQTPEGLFQIKGTGRTSENTEVLIYALQKGLL